MSGSALANALVLVFLLGFGYLLVIRPTRKRAQAVTALQNALSVGDDVMLTSGIFATVVEILDEKVRVELAEGVIVSVHRGAIGKIVRDVPDDASYESDPSYESYESADPDPADPIDPTAPSGPEKPGAN